MQTIKSYLLTGVLAMAGCGAPEPVYVPPATPPAEQLPATVPTPDAQHPTPGAVYSPEEQEQAWEVMKCGGPCEPQPDEADSPPPERICGEGQWLVVEAGSWHCEDGLPPAR